MLVEKRNDLYIVNIVVVIVIVVGNLMVYILYTCTYINY